MNNLVKKFCIILIIISIIFPVFASTAVLAVEDISNADEKVNQEKSEISDSISNNDIPNENASDSDSLPKDDSEIDVEPPDSQDSDVDNESNNSETVDNTNNDIIDDENIGTDDVVVDLDEFPEEIITMDEPIQSQLRTATSNQKLADGTYVIKSALNSNMALTVANGETHNGANIELWDSYNFMYQKFNVRYVNGFYEIISVHSNKSLDVANAGMVNGTNVQLCEFTNHNAQKWILQDAGNGYFYIISKCNNLYVDVFYALARNGTNIQMCEGSQNNRAQMFKFEVVQPIEAKQQSIADGTYTIHSALNENFVLEVANNSLQNGGNIQLFANSSYINQKFNLRYLNNGYYEFTSYTSKKSFDVANSGVTNGTNVQQHTANNSDFQQWILQDAGNGYFYIISKYNELCLDVANGIARNGTNIQLCQKTNHRAQMFKFEKVKPIEAKQQSIADGIYTIHSALNENFVLEVDNGSPYNRGNIRISQNSSYIHQKFNLKYLGNGYYQITSYQYGKSFDVANSGVTNGTNVQQYDANNSDFQQWILQDAGNGYYNIISKYNELNLDIANGLARQFVNVQLCQGTPNNRAQMFKFEKVEPIEDGKKTIPNGVYQIQSGLNLNFVLDVYGASSWNGANVQLFRNCYTSNQKFAISYTGDGYYEIRPIHSGRALDIANSGVTNGTNVQQYGVNNSDFQRWIIKDVGNGYYNIISKYNELYLDVADGLPKNESNIQLCQGTPNNKAQMFKFISAGTKRGIDVSQWQGNIDWGAVKASGQVDFAIIRAGYRGWGTEGTLQVDPYFVKNVREAAANNIDIGLYFFTQATNVPEAIEEANFVLNLVRQYNVNLTYPIFIDTEDSGAVNSGKVGRADNLDVWTRTQVCKAFVDTIESYGYRSGIYASRNWFYEKLNTPELITGDIWLAHYTYDVNKKSDFKYRYQLWQYTSSGYIPGINGNVDLNVAYY